MAKNLEQRVEELEKLVKGLMKEKTKSICKNLRIGDEFEVASLKWKILDITDKGYVCLADKLEDKKQFDQNCNDWRDSSLRKYLNSEFYEMLAAEIGEENIIPFERDLFSLDGQKEYGICEDTVSLITVDEYRKYRKYIPNAQYYWWTCTPDSTKSNGDTTWIRVVSPSGFISCSFCVSRNGVRPVCIFSSSIFESEE